MRILLTGAGGQLGTELLPGLQALGEVTALDRHGCDLASEASIRKAVEASRPAIIVNAGAYTAVNDAESHRELAMAVNGRAPGVLAEEARKLGAIFIHYSTDYVFDGRREGAYTEDDATAPLNVYGASKLAGEQAVAAAGGRWLVLRTSWVYGAKGNNFLMTIRRLAREREELRIVADQTGAPTSTIQLAKATARILREMPTSDFPSGVYHATAAGSTSWHGFAEAIVQGLREHESLKVERVVGITSDEYPTPAQRPMNSVLSNDKFARAFGFRLGSWEDGLAEVLRELYR